MIFDKGLELVRDVGYVSVDQAELICIRSINLLETRSRVHCLFSPFGVSSISLSPSLVICRSLSISFSGLYYNYPRL